MKLEITNCDDMDFIQFVVDYFIKWVRSNLDIKKLSRLDEYLQSIYRDNSLRCQDVINAALQTLEVYKDPLGNMVTISIDRVRMFRNTELKIYDLISYITYGTISLQGYPIIKDGFTYISENIAALEMLYKYGRQ